jgi:hypothetical protein
MEEIEDTKRLDKKTVEPIPPNQTKHATNLNLFTLICIHHGRLGSIGNDLQLMVQPALVLAIVQVQYGNQTALF